MTDLPALLARLEAADAGSRELSDEALLATGRWARHGVLWSVQLTPGVWTPWCHPAPDPTNSLDDARRWLVPEGWSVRILIHPAKEDAPEVCYVEIYLLDEKLRRWRGALDRKVLAGPEESESKEPALALCAAALRAKEAQAEGEG